MRARKLMRPLVGLTASLVVGTFAILFLARMDVTVDGRGVMRPIHYAELRPVHAGRVIEVRVTDSDPVKAGDVILVQDATQEQFMLQGVESEMEKAEEDLKACLGRVQRERENRIARMDADVKSAEADIVRQERDIQAAELSLREALENPIQVQISTAKERLLQQEIRVKDAKKGVDDAKELYEKGMQSKLSVEKAISGLLLAESDLKVRANEIEILEQDAKGLNVEKARKALETKKATLETLKAALEGRKRDFEKAQMDLKNDDRERDVRLQISKQKIERDRLKKIIDEKTIRAPMDGIVADFRTKPSNMISPSDRLGWVYDVSDFKFYANIRQVDIWRVKTGQKVELYLDALPYRKEGTFDATVIEISAVADKPSQELAAAGIDVNSMQGLVICKVTPCDKSKLFRVGYTGLSEVIVGRSSVVAVLAGYEDVEGHSLEASRGEGPADGKCEGGKGKEAGKP